MNQRYQILCLFLLLLVCGCGKKEAVTPDGLISFSELETKHDYYLPFALQNDTNIIRMAVLNGDTIEFTYGASIEFTGNGFYELILVYNDPDHETDTILFTTTTEERRDSEWGIRAWVPDRYANVWPGTGDIQISYPRRFADSINVPFIFFVMEDGGVKPVYCRGGYVPGGDWFNIKRGVGSVSIAASRLFNHADFDIGDRKVRASLNKISKTVMELKGTVSSAVIIPENSLARVTGNLDITSTGSLTVNAGALLLVDEAVDINIRGPVYFLGTAGNPVLVTCSLRNKFWGGFIARGPAGTIEAQHTIFCQSGYHDSDEYAWGHAGRQALFYIENSTLNLDHCFMTDHIGQIFYPQNATLILDNILVQRAKTGGQINHSVLTLTNSFFTDFPDDSYIFRDEDNDALYLIATDAVIENTVFMFAKDDGLDSGGDEGGNVAVTNCRFEACFHEGTALSSSGSVVKQHIFTGCVFTNCGQGLELGYSSPNHTVTVDDCLFLGNGIGIRYGDNYTWSDVSGTISVRNSSSLYNDRDVWNMIRKRWSPKLGNMIFENTTVSRFCPQYPGLQVKE